MPADQIGMYSRIPKSLDGLFYTNQGRNLKVWNDFQDFDCGSYAANIGLWTVGLVGAGAAISPISGTALRKGIAGCNTGTTATGRATIYTLGPNGDGILFGAGEYTFETDINIPTLSIVGEEYVLQIGFGDTSGADFIDGAYFRYDRLADGNNWRCKTASNSARTNTDSGYAVATGWQRLKIVVNSDGTQVKFYRNDVLCATLTTNIPTGASRETGGLIQILKSAGVTPTYLNIDWIWMHINYNTSR